MTIINAQHRTLGEIVSNSLLTEHDDWRDEYGEIVNQKMGWRLFTTLLRGGLSFKEALSTNLPLVEAERKEVIQSMGKWRAENTRRLRDAEVAKYLSASS